MSGGFGRQAAQHRRQDAAARVVVDVDRPVEAGDRLEPSLPSGTAGSVILAGHDCGQLGESAYMKDYGTAEKAMGYAVQNTEWLIALERQSRAVKKQLTERYGCRVYSLSPFISPDLEGVPFRGTNVLNFA